MSISDNIKFVYKIKKIAKMPLQRWHFFYIALDLLNFFLWKDQIFLFCKLDDYKFLHFMHLSLKPHFWFTICFSRKLITWWSLKMEKDTIWNTYYVVLKRNLAMVDIVFAPIWVYCFYFSLFLFNVCNRIYFFSDSRSIAPNFKSHTSNFMAF